MVEINKETIHQLIEQRRLAIIARNPIFSKERIDVRDALATISIFVLMGKIDLYSDPNDFLDRNTFVVDEATKRVTQLILDCNSIMAVPLQIPIHAILPLGMLKVLKLLNVNIFPSTDGVNNGCQPIEKLQFENLKQLDILYTFRGDGGDLLDIKYFDMIPSLEKISFRILTRKTETIFIRNMLVGIQSQSCAFRHTLREIDLGYSMCTQDQLEILLVNVAPKLTNIKRIKLNHNEIESIKRVSDRLNLLRGIHNEQHPCYDTLQTLDLSSNAVTLKFKNDPEEVAALMCVLQRFRRLFDLGRNFCFMGYPSELTTQLHKNRTAK